MEPDSICLVHSYYGCKKESNNNNKIKVKKYTGDTEQVAKHGPRGPT